MKKFLFVLLAFYSFLTCHSNNGETCFNIPLNLQAATFNCTNGQIASDTSGKILLTSSGAGLIIFDGVNYSNFNTSNSNINSNFTKDVAVDASNNYYVATDSGMSVYNGNSWYNYTPFNSGIISANLRVIYCANNTIYLGGNTGFSIYNTGIFTNYSTANSGLSNDTINDFALDVNADFWIATNNGLCKLSGSNFTTYTTLSSSISSNYIKFLYADGTDLWFITSARQVNRFQNNTFQLINQILNTPLDIKSRSQLCKGPKGGVLFFDLNTIYEITPNKVYSYFLNQSFCQLYSFTEALFYTNSTQTLWVKGQNKSFASLNFGTYNNLLFSSGSIQNTPDVTYDNCKAIDINQINSAIMNLGDMCWNTQTIKFEVPKGGGKHAIFANSLWMGGLDSTGNLRVAAQTYRQTGNDYWPGPLDTVTGNTDTAKAVQYNKIWKLNRSDIETFKYNFSIGTVQNGSFIPVSDILDWPAQDTGNYTRNMAPFVDLNNDGVYNPLSDGDYPLIKGDQMLYWIFNDNLALHTESDALPLKAEVHASAYAFNNPTLSTVDSLINYCTFYHYQIFNRGQFSLDSCYLGNWTDYDLGNPNDDYFGTNVQHNLVYCYNSDSLDETNFDAANYGLNPPVISSIILNGPLAYPNDGRDNNNDGTIDEPGEKDLLTSSIFSKNDFSLSGIPQNTSHYYNYLKAFWKDNTQLTFGGNGYGGASPRKFIWPDYPNLSNGWHQSTLADGRVIQGCGPFRFASGSSVDYDFAFVFTRDTTLAYNSNSYYNRIGYDATKVKNWFDQNSFPAVWLTNNGVAKEDEIKMQLQLMPNPANAFVLVRFSNNSNLIEVKIIDVMGKTVYVSTQSNSSIQKLNTAHLRSGIYFVEASDKNGNAYYSKFVKQ